jgi:hypothetical protein
VLIRESDKCDELFDVLSYPEKKRSRPYNRTHPSTGVGNGSEDAGLAHAKSVALLNLFRRYIFIARFMASDTS